MKNWVIFVLAALAIFLLFFRTTSGFRNLPGGVVTAYPRQDGDVVSTAYSYNKGALSLWGYGF